MSVITSMADLNITGLFAISSVRNSSEKFDNSSQLNELITTTPEKWKEIGRMSEVIVRPILVLFGTIFNILSFYVMRRGSLKKVSTCFYMSILALADTGKLILSYIIYEKMLIDLLMNDPRVKKTNTKQTYIKKVFCY